MKNMLHPDGYYEVTNLKLDKLPKNWQEKMIEWGGRKYLPTD